MKGIQLDELSDEVRAQLGLANSQDEEIVAPRVEALGKVLRALKGLTNQQAISVLSQAQEHIMGKHVSVPGRPLTLQFIIQTVAIVFNQTVDDLKGRRRTTDLALARQVAMYVAGMNEKYTLTAIGDALGGRSPATISHGFQLVAEKIRFSATLRSKVSDIRIELSGGD